MKSNKNEPLKCVLEKCQRKARWEVGFTTIVRDSFLGIFEGSGNNDFQQSFCDRHFIELNGCGNTVEFRQIGEKKWKDFSDYDNPFTLRDLVKKSYKIYVSYKLKFNKITNFFQK